MPPPRPPMQASAPAPQPDRVRAADLSRLSPGTGVPGPEAEPATITRRAPYPSRLYVQAASYVTRAQAERARRSIAGLGPAVIYMAYVDDQLRYRVRIGPLRTPERSESVRAALVRRGYGDAIIVRD
ncbi:MAG TPA: SPOR domain-containing protein [Alphaproteobacteria bacterium]